MADIQTSFHPIHFALQVPDGEVRIYVWRSLDEALVTFKTLLPNLRQTLTADAVRALAIPDQAKSNLLTRSEYAALWLAKVVWDNDTHIPREQVEELYDAAGALGYARRLLAGTARPDVPFVYLSEWAESVRPLLFDRESNEKPIFSESVRRKFPVVGLSPCRLCGTQPVGIEFRHTPPNWMVCCPTCGWATNPQEGYNRAMALDAWNRAN